jgi:hypothetical protein
MQSFQSEVGIVLVKYYFDEAIRVKNTPDTTNSLKFLLKSAVANFKSKHYKGQAIRQDTLAKSGTPSGNLCRVNSVCVVDPHGLQVALVFMR